jgi:hypothetical protein
LLCHEGNWMRLKPWRVRLTSGLRTIKGYYSGRAKKDWSEIKLAVRLSGRWILSWRLVSIYFLTRNLKSLLFDHLSVLIPPKKWISETVRRARECTQCKMKLTAHQCKVKFKRDGNVQYIYMPIPRVSKTSFSKNTCPWVPFPILPCPTYGAQTQANFLRQSKSCASLHSRPQTRFPHFKHLTLPQYPHISQNFRCGGANGGGGDARAAL